MPSLAMYRLDQNDTEVFALPADICYVLSFERADRHLLDIRMEVSTRGEPWLDFVLPSWTPGSYKIREFITNFTLEGVLDEQGHLLEVEWREKNCFRVLCDHAEKVYLKAVYFGNERSVRTTYLSRWQAFIMPSNCLPYIRGRQFEPHHLVIEVDPARWRHITTPLSPVDFGFPPRLGALTYDILADSPIQIGNHRICACTVGGRLHEIALVSDEPVDDEWIVRTVDRVVRVVWAFWGGELPYDRYVFIFHFAPNVFGGLEHARSHVLAVDPAALRELAGTHRFLRLLCHEFFHTWNGKRIRPEGHGPFEYSHEHYTQLLWLTEGVTTYYEILLPYWCDFFTQRELLVHLALEIEQLSHVPGRFYLSVRDSSFLAWVKLYGRSPDGPNRFPSYYLKGALIAWLLDIWILEQTAGRKRLQDGLRELWQRARRRPERGFTEDEVIGALEDATGVSLGSTFVEWLTDRGELPYADFLSRIGLQLQWHSALDRERLFGEKYMFGRLPGMRFTGLSLREERGSLVVETVEEFSPAAIAGIAIGDEIIALNGVRVQSLTQWDALIGMADEAVEVLAASDGRLYTTRLAQVSLYRGVH
ncbi:MAG: PDZ domain-containing protein, partial [Bacteroidota bacterium]|nr:PDZ domain-containing protein [Bacteroidota bacterium]